MMTKKKNNRGGARLGAGRKKGPDKIAVTLRMSKEIVSLLPRNKSDFVEAILREKLQ